MSSYAGRFQRINLSNGKTIIETVPESVKRDFLGGRGFGIKYLYDEVSAGIHPLSPDNKLLFINGPLIGTKATSCSRWVVCTKSPLSGTIMRSVCGGPLGYRMNWVGLDFIIIEGKAE